MKPIEERIELYLGGKLSKEEVAEFEKELKEDKKLARELDLQKVAKAVILQNVQRERAKLGYIEHFQKLGKELSEKEKAKENWLEKTIEGIQGFFEISLEKILKIDLDPFASRKVAVLAMPISAMILAFVLFKGALLLRPGPSFIDSDQALAYHLEGKAGYWNPDNIEGLKLVRGGRDSVEINQAIELYQKTIQTYNNGQFDKALEGFLAIENDSIMKKIQLPLGISYFKTKEFQKAKEILESYNTEDENADEHRWYLILTLFALKENEKLSEELCNYIERDNVDFKASEAQKLRRTLKIKCK